MGYGTAIAVIVAVSTAVTLLPAVLAKLGHGIDRGRLPWAKRNAQPTLRTASSPASPGSSRGTRSWPWSPRSRFLLTMAIPVLSINMGTADAGTAPASTTKRQAYDLLAEGFGPGFNGPLLVAVDKERRHATPSTACASRSLDRGRRRRGHRPAIENEAGDTAQIAVYPTTSPQSAETAELVGTLRDERSRPRSRAPARTRTSAARPRRTRTSRRR